MNASIFGSAVVAVALILVGCGGSSDEGPGSGGGIRLPETSLECGSAASTPETLVDNQRNARGVDTDGTTLYWSTLKLPSAGGEDAIHRKPLDGGTPETLLPDVKATAVRVTPRYVYFHNASAVRALRRQDSEGREPFNVDFAGGYPRHLLVQGDALYWHSDFCIGYQYVNRAEEGEYSSTKFIDSKEVCVDAIALDEDYLYYAVHEHGSEGGSGAIKRRALDTDADDEPDDLVVLDGLDTVRAMAVAGDSLAFIQERPGEYLITDPVADLFTVPKAGGAPRGLLAHVYPEDAVSDGSAAYFSIAECASVVRVKNGEATVLAEGMGDLVWGLALTPDRVLVAGNDAIYAVAK